MFRIDSATASPTLPTPAAPGTAGYFSFGDPASGVPPTVVDPDIMNMIMMELLNVVTAAGLTPSKTTYNQVLQALLKGFSASSSLTNPGYLTVFGLVIQWGIGQHHDNTGAEPITFPIAFATSQFMAVASNATSSGIPAAYHGTGNYSTTGMTIHSTGGAGGAATSGTSFTWIALGH